MFNDELVKNKTERDIEEIWDQPGMENVSGESQGTLRITVEYIPSEDEKQE